MSAMEWADTSDHVSSPEQLARLERNVFAAHPQLLEIVDRQTREFAAEAAEIESAHDGAALRAEAASQRESLASRVPGFMRFLLGAAVLLGPVVALALIIVRRAFPLSDSIAVGAVLQSMAGVAAILALSALLIDRRPLGVPARVLDGASVAAILTVCIGMWQAAASPLIAGADVGRWIVLDVAGALAIVGLDAGERVMRSRALSALERDTAGLKPRAAAYEHELGSAYAARLGAITAAVEALPLDARLALRDDRAAAIERLVRRARMSRSTADQVSPLRLGELCLCAAPRDAASS